MNKTFLQIQRSGLDANRPENSPFPIDTYDDALKSTLNQFFYEAVDEFMKFFSEEDRKKILEMSYRRELKFSKDKLNRLVQDYWTNYEPEETEVA